MLCFFQRPYTYRVNPEGQLQPIPISPNSASGPGMFFSDVCTHI